MGSAQQRLDTTAGRSTIPRVSWPQMARSEPFLSGTTQRADLPLVTHQGKAGSPTGSAPACSLRISGANNSAGSRTGIAPTLAARLLVSGRGRVDAGFTSSFFFRRDRPVLAPRFGGGGTGRLTAIGPVTPSPRARSFYKPRLT